jgi:hypothetical protein
VTDEPFPVADLQPADLEPAEPVPAELEPFDPAAAPGEGSP